MDQLNSCQRPRAARVRSLALVALAGVSLAACASVTPHYAVQTSPTPRAAAPGPTGYPSGYKVGAPYQVGGIWYVPREQPGYDETGIASWYGDAFHLKPTADGEIFDKAAPSAAHTTLPLPSMVEVTNLDNGRKLVVRVNDRGPFVGGRIIDLSQEAARQLGYDRAGLAHVRVRYIGPAPLYGEDTLRYARYQPPSTSRASTREAAAPPPGRSASDVSRDVVMTSSPLPRAAPPVLVSELAPLPAPRPATAATFTSAARGTSPSLRPATAFRVQAGAFSTAENAHRAVAALAPAGAAAVEPVSRGGVTLWRVMLDGATDEDSAEALRQRVATYGFADARVIRPF